jgi:hypothetical protein
MQKTGSRLTAWPHQRLPASDLERYAKSVNSVKYPNPFITAHVAGLLLIALLFGAVPIVLPLLTRNNTKMPCSYSSALRMF